MIIRIEKLRSYQLRSRNILYCNGSGYLDERKERSKDEIFCWVKLYPAIVSHIHPAELSFKIVTT